MTKKSLMLPILLTAVLLTAFASCSKKSDDLTLAKKELDSLITEIVDYHKKSIILINSTGDVDKLLQIISNVTMAKSEINPGIDRIAQKYPNLNPEQVEIIKAVMGEKIQELMVCSGDFEKAVDGAIRAHKDQQAESTSLILALKKYQMLGQ